MKFLLSCLAFWIAVAIVTWIYIPAEAQQKPFVGYTINGGCLYITPQGFAVIREWNDTKDDLLAEKVCE